MATNVLNGLTIYGPVQANNSLINLNYETTNNATVLFYKIATLPATSSATSDLIRIKAMVSGWGGSAGLYDIVLSNRGSSGTTMGTLYFSCQGTQLTGSAGAATVGFQAWRTGASTTSVDVYAYFGLVSSYENLSFTVDSVNQAGEGGTPATLYPAPAQYTAAPSGGGGAVMFDTATATPDNIFLGNTNLGPTTGTGNLIWDTTSKINWVSANSRLGVRQASPTSTLHLGGSLALASRSIQDPTNSTTLSETDGVIFCNTYNGSSGSANSTVTLPAASTCAGRCYVAKQTGGTGTLTVAPNGSDLIEGVNSNYSVGGNLTYAKFVSDGVSWWKIG